ncbi:hypothetical protein BGZ60DRAFT_284348 [Tricladium varicosporioides]|nr:hypothetical protein BGZ60DRAFT_284348 [Hymenoscyphus varicosporioides]
MKSFPLHFSVAILDYLILFPQVLGPQDHLTNQARKFPSKSFVANRRGRRPRPHARPFNLRTNLHVTILPPTNHYLTFLKQSGITKGRSFCCTSQVEGVHSALCILPPLFCMALALPIDDLVFVDRDRGAMMEPIIWSSSKFDCSGWFRFMC